MGSHAAPLVARLRRARSRGEWEALRACAGHRNRGPPTALYEESSTIDRSKDGRGHTRGSLNQPSRVNSYKASPRLISLILTAILCVLPTFGAGQDAGRAKADSFGASVREFARRTYVHGPPYAQTRRFGRAALPTLEAMLSDSADQQSWPTVCSMISHLGYADGYPLLHQFIWARFKGTVRGPQLSALRVAQQGIGFIAAESPDALRYLLNGTDPNYWRHLPWSESGESQESVGLEFARLSTSALPFSQNPLARATLVRLRDTSTIQPLRSQAERGIAEYDTIAVHGLSWYMAHVEAVLSGKGGGR